MYARLFITACALIAASDASAQRTPEMTGPPRWTQVNWPAPPLRWTCVQPGFREVELGGRACLRAPNGWRYATCERVYNVTNWRFTQEECREGQP